MDRVKSGKARYQIVSKLGRGGTGQVYRVWDIQLEKEWAMKEVEGEASMELKMLKELSSPYFPRVVDAFSEEGKNYLVMDYIQGITLEELLKKKALEEREIISLSGQIVKAIAYLHSRTPTLLYLDLKPSNVMVEEDGEIKLVDLGSIRIKGKIEGRISGTPGFASPEQMERQYPGDCLDERSDIFSFGILLYMMMSGGGVKLPVIGKEKRQGIVMPMEHSSFSPALGQILEKATRGVVEGRFSSMRDIKHRLEVLEGKAGRQPGRWMRRLFCGKNWDKGQEWYQEKSILCTCGKQNLYMRVILLVLLGSIWLLPAERAKAGENNEANQLGVILRDSVGRKILVRKDRPYQTMESLFLELPWEAVEGEDCIVEISCLSTSGKKKSYRLEWVKN